MVASERQWLYPSPGNAGLCPIWVGVCDPLGGG
jgi:hypothetical protein